MRALHIHLDPLGGAAGDMFVAATLHAFPALEERVRRDVMAVLPKEAGKVTISEGLTGGMSALRFQLVDGDHASHRTGQDTTYAAMKALIEKAQLSDGTAREAVAILHRIAEAEAKVHGIPLEHVHFHEIADWDSLMDVTAGGSLVAALSDCRWSLGPVPLGAGRVATAHGLLPVPAPATVEILTGYDWTEDGVAGERVTPTGAAILAHVTGGKGNGTHPGGRLVATGSGAGTRDLKGLPNILRLTAFERVGPADVDMVVQLACDVDDMTGEEIGWAADRLRAAVGLRDLVLAPVQGKKGRPAMRLELLVAPESEADLTQMLFDVTTTLGIRRQQIMRYILPRSTADTKGGRVKLAERPSGQTRKVESDDLANASSLAERRGRARREE